MKAISKNWRHEYVVVMGLLLGAFFLRLPLLNGSFWLDEAAQVLESARPLSQQLNIRDDFQPPLIHLLTHVLLWFDRSEVWLRLGAAVVPAMISLLFTYRIARKLAGREVAIGSLIFLTVSSFHIFYSQELRPYALPLMFATLTWWQLLHRRWIPYTLLSIAGWYSSYLYPFLWLSQVLWVISPWHERGKKEIPAILASSGAVGIAFLPWIPSLVGQLQAGTQLRLSFAGWENIVGYGPLKIGALVIGKFFFGILDLEPTPAFIIPTMVMVGTMLLALALLRKELRHRGSQVAQTLQVCFFWGILPTLVAWTLSWVIPILQPKRILFTFPGLAIGGAALLFFAFAAARRKSWQRAVFVLATMLIFLVQFYGTTQYFTQSKYQREDWRDAYHWIAQRYQPENTVIVQAFVAPFAAWEWYNSPPFRTISIGGYSMESPEAAERLKDVAQYDNVIVFDYLRDLTDPERRIETILSTYGYIESNRLTPATPLGIVHVFTKRTYLLTGTP